MTRQFITGHVSRTIADLVAGRGRVGSHAARLRIQRRRRLLLEGLESRTLLSASWGASEGDAAVGFPGSLDVEPTSSAVAEVAMQDLDSSWTSLILGDALVMDSAATVELPLLAGADGGPGTGLTPYGAAATDASEFMLGDVWVTVVLLESDGSIDAQTENWSPSRIATVKSEITEGLSWWETTLASRFPSSPHALEFHLDFTYADNPVTTGYEPITRPQSNEGLWIDSFLNHVGYNTASGYGDDLVAWNDDRREANDCHWAYTIFVADSSADSDGSFSDGYFAYAYLGGPFTVMTYDNSGWGISRMGQVLAHETGHIFYALDEYPGASTYTAHAGYYSTQNLNAYTGHPAPASRVPSIMAEATLQNTAYPASTSSPSSLAMLGWQDTDADGIFDVLDVPLTLTGTGAYNAAAGQYEFAGTSSVGVLTNLNPYGLNHDLTINTVDRIQYRLDGGAWIDGNAYGGYTANVAQLVPVTAGGVHTLDFRTLVEQTGVTSAVWSDTFTVGGSTSVPEVAVLAGGVNLSDGTATVNFGSTEVGVPVSQSFVIQNLGSGDLSVGAVLSLPSGFTLVSASPATLFNGTSTTVLPASGAASFTVRFNAPAAGTYSGTLSFSNNDSDENPFNFTVQGQATLPAATKAILDDGDAGFTAGGFTTYASGAGYLSDVRYAMPGTGSKVAQWQFAFANYGLTDGLYRVSTLWYVQGSRTNNASFKLYSGTATGTPQVTAAVNQQVAPRADVVDQGRNWQDLGVVAVSGGMLTVTVSDAVPVGAVVADAVRIEKMTPAPEIQVVLETTGADLTDGTGVVDFGSVFAGSTAQVTLRVKNVGSAALTLSSPTVPTGFTLVSGFGSTTLAANDGAAGGADETTFTLAMNTATTGSKSGGLAFANNDANENPFNLTLQGAVSSVSSVKIIDNGDSGYSENTAWIAWSDGYQGDLRYSAKNTGRTATWTFTGLPAGTYRISTTWVLHSNRATNAPYTISDGGGTVLVNQELAPNNAAYTWVLESGKYFADLRTGLAVTDGTLVVSLTDVGANEYVIADAVRIERVGAAAPPASPARAAVAPVQSGRAAASVPEAQRPALTQANHERALLSFVSDEDEVPVAVRPSVRTAPGTFDAALLELGF